MNPNVTDNSSFYRIVMIGDTLVGKTSIVNKLIYDTFNEKELPTIGSMFALYTSNSSNIDMQIWDTAGQERFRSLTPIYFQNADAGVFVFDISQPSTFHHLDSWISLYIESVGSNTIIVIVGNKIDLQSNNELNNTTDNNIVPNQNHSGSSSNAIFVDETEARKWAESKKYTYFSTSAKNGYGIHDVFQYISEELVRRRKQVSIDPIPVNTEQEKERSFCSC